jgi:hypothetical protein
MRISVLIRIIAFALLPLCGSAAPPGVIADEAQAGADRYNTLLKYDLMATTDVLDKYGKPLRIATHLQECKLEALADTIAPGKEKIAAVVIRYLTDQPGGKSNFWEVLPAVTSSVSMYQIGYKESSVAMHKIYGEKFCQDVTKQANEILRDSKAAK